MVEVEINQSEKGSFFHLTGDVTIGLTNEQYKELILVSRKFMRQEGYFMQYKALRCVISEKDAQQLIDLGATVSESLPT